MKKDIFLLFICIFVFGWSYGQKPIKFEADSPTEFIGHSLYYYIPHKEIELKEVMHAPFEPCEKIVPNFDIHAHSVWLRFTIENNSDIEPILLHINNATLEEAVLYFQENDAGKTDSIVVNHTSPLTAGSYRGRTAFIFALKGLHRGETATYYLRVRSTLPLILPIVVNDPHDELSIMLAGNTMNSIFLGVIVVMALYNFFLFLSIRDKAYLLYVLFILFTGITQLSLKGLSLQAFGVNSLIPQNINVTFFSALGGIFAILFTIRFLRTPALVPKLNKVLLFFLIGFFIAIVVLLFNQVAIAYRIIRTATTLSALLILYISIYIVRKGNDPSSIYFLFAWSFLIFGALTFLMANYGVLPYSRFTDYSMQLATVIEIILLSFALANRINILKKEREKSQQETLRLANENRVILRKQNAILEKQVEERTRELFNKNTALQAANEHLKETQTQLVAAEKMSSLGQLTAGIAHEINNPINFVSANISPLKRDVQMLFDTISTIEAIGLEEGKAASVKLLEMAAYKNEQELDELQEEIDLLLNGIHDGATRTANIVRGLRLFSRLDEDDWKEADLNEGLQSTLAITGNILKGIDIQTDYGAIPPVTCYPGKLNQVFLNIITNGAFAIRQQHGDNIGGRLWLKTWQEGEFVFVSIKDDGIGMDEATLNKLYEPFFTTKPVGEGTGLGMSIVFTIVEQHQARLSVRSTPGEGTEFTLKLYIHPPAKGNQEPAALK